MGTVACFMFHVPLCTPEGEPKAPEVSQSGKMFYPSPVLIQRKADGLLCANCIDPVRGVSSVGLPILPISLWESMCHQMADFP